MNEEMRTILKKGSPTITLGTSKVQFDLVRILPGEFTMGSPESEEGHSLNEAPERRVRITKAFYLGKFEVTHAQYWGIMGEFSSGVGGDTLPISQITYANALEFCRRLSNMLKVEVRLPTEAEWEYACRAGTQTPYSSGSTNADLNRVAWYDENSNGKVHPVGQKQPNNWGLYDMHGNVWEFCADFIEDYATMHDTNPIGQISLTYGAMRGGGWMHGLQECRAATRFVSDDMFGGAGFRIAISCE